MVVPLEAFPRLEEDGKARRDLENVLNEAVNLIDLRTPYNESFYQALLLPAGIWQKHFIPTLPVMRKSLQAALVTRTLTWHGGGLLHRPGKKCAAVLQLC